MTYAKFNTDRVIRWRLIIEEYGPNLKYIEGPKNVVVDALSRLGLKDNPEFHSQLEQFYFYQEEVNAVQDDVPVRGMPLDLGYIKEHQEKEKSLTDIIKKDKTL